MDFKSITEIKDAQSREQAIKTLVGGMSLDEKIHLMAGVDFAGSFRPYGSRTFPAGGNSRLGIPCVEFTDGPRGVMLDHSTCFPVTAARGATWDPELEERIGTAMGLEAAAQGANMSGAVCINVLRHPAWGRAQETYGEDPMHLGEMGVALTKGLQKNVMACVKHFAANSIECSRFYVNVKMDERTLREIYLPHFKRCVDAGAASIMGAYNRLNGPHCCHNRRLLREILKNEWKFDGIVISDFNMGLRSADAVVAGLDIEMPWRVYFGMLLKQRVNRGGVMRDVIDDAAARIIRQLARFSLPSGTKPPPKSVVACEEHRLLALEAAQKSIVLLKNRDALLPLDSGRVRRIAVIGKLAGIANMGDDGSSIVWPPYSVTPLEGILSRAGSAVSVVHDDGTNVAHACKAARNADVAIVFVGLTHRDEGEFIPLKMIKGDRVGLSLSQSQERLIRSVAAANKACIVVLEGGSAFTIDKWAEKAAAILMAWYPGMEGGTAIASVLFGDINPGGKLPVMFPRAGQALPQFDRWARSVRYDLWHGYRHADHFGLKPMFPFGFGLSYAKFEYSNPSVSAERTGPDSPVDVSFDVTNTGPVAGDEVVQLYVSYPASEVDRPVRELKAFRRVNVRPGETHRVTLSLNPADLAYYDTPASMWRVERTPYRIHIGSSSSENDLPLALDFTVD